MSDQDDQAKKRTRWSEDRTVLANERTFASWIGTGLGAIGVAIGLKAVFGAFEPTWVAKTVASMFLVSSILIFWSARRQAHKTLRRLSENDAEAQPVWYFTVLATVLTVSTLATGAVLWSL